MLQRLGLPERFAVLGAVLFLLAGSALTYTDYRLAVERMEAIGHNANMVAIRTLWSHIQSVAMPFLGIGAGDLAARETEASLIERIERGVYYTLVNTDIGKIKIYDTNGRVRYSTDRGQIGADEWDNPRFRMALAGYEISRKERFASIVTVHGLQHDRVMQASYIPIYGSKRKGEAVGVFEIYTDFTAMEDAAQIRAWIRLAILGLALAILYGLLVLFVTHSHRALLKAEQARLSAVAEVVKVRAEDASKSAFLAHMSHELRTPLNAIIGFSEFIENSRSLNLPQHKAMEYAGDIRTSAQHLLHIINDLLDLTRLDLGRIRPEIEDVDLAAVFAEALSMVRPQAERGGVVLAADFPDGLPPIRTDRQRVKQILVNLLSNAVKFTPEHGTVTGSIALRPDRRVVVFRVADTGIGMSGDDASDRHNVLRYGDALIARKAEGAGLGLPLCHRYAKLLGGELRIESELGKGTNVTLEIPLALADDKDKKRSHPHAA